MSADELPYFEAADAVAVADELFDAELDDGKPPPPEPADQAAAAIAVNRLGYRFQSLPGTVRHALQGAESKADQLSGDRLQGLAEIVQNADDVGATEVRFQLLTGAEGLEILAAHDGSPVRLRDVLALATPWLTTKASDPDATGRFGIGLMTLRSLSAAVDVHCSPYHLRLGAPSLAVVAPRAIPGHLGSADWTLLRIPVDNGAVGPDDVQAWLTSWDDSALLFLRHVRRISLLDADGSVLVELRLTMCHEEEIASVRSDSLHDLRRCQMVAGDGRTWEVYRAQAAPPDNAHRAHKVSGQRMPLAVAFAVDHAEPGWVYSGTPIRPFGLPIRVSAQFDPLASRQDLADTDWNLALIPYLSDLWIAASLDVFARSPARGWHTVPSDELLELDRLTRGRLAGAIVEQFMVRGRRELARYLHLRADGTFRRLPELAVEEPPLTTVLSESDIARLGGTPAAFPFDVRDGDGRWRTVLASFSHVAAEVPVNVSVGDALALLSEVDTPPSLVAGITAAALEVSMGERLRTLPCVVTADGRHITPPLAASPEALVAGELDPLSMRLGLAVTLHDEYVSTPAGRQVLAWLKNLRCLVDSPSATALVDRLAAAGHAGNSIQEPLSDSQTRALRETLEGMAPTERERLGPGIGKAVRFAATSYGTDGRPRHVAARPCEAYLIEREQDSWSAAAGRTPGLIWLHRKYSDLLRSPLGRDGLGAQRFFRLLGAESAPRPVPHSRATERYVGKAPGVSRDLGGSPQLRIRKLRELDATYTVNDYECPDLEAVLRNIGADDQAPRRQRRAQAVLASLSRAWDRLGQFASARAMAESYGWVAKGGIPAWWVLQAAETPWLPDMLGTYRPPRELRLRTPGTVAVYGPDPDRYLHRDFAVVSRRPVLDALGVTSDPPVSELVDALRQLRDSQADPSTDDATSQRAAGIYRALAAQIPPGANVRAVGDVPAGRVRQWFASPPGLILTRLGWRTPSSVFSGPAVFGDLHAFVPPVANCDRLWRLLGIGAPDARDCVDVLRQLSRRRGDPSPEDVLVLLETLRLLVATFPDAEPPPRLNRLVLLTSKGWTGRRPAYVTDDAQLAEALAPLVPVWRPGGDLGQFRTLIAPLGLTELSPADASVVEPDSAEEAAEATELFHEAVKLLQADLARNDPDAEASGSMSWEDLVGCEVRLHPHLRIRIAGTHLPSPPVIDVPAHLDRGGRVLYVGTEELLGRVDGGGGAVAAQFKTDRRRIAYAWRVAWDEAEAGRKAQMLKLASRRAQEEQDAQEAARAARLESLQMEVAERHAVGTAARGQQDIPAPRPGQVGPSSSQSQSHTPNPSAATNEPRSPRRLVNLDNLELVNPNGERLAGTSSGHPRGGGHTPRSLIEPDLGRRHSAGGGRIAAEYTPIDKETVGLELVRRVLASDAEQVIDIRNQRGVGADAIDDLRRFYELKVYAGTEPDLVRLTDSEVQRALTTQDFFLVIVSNVESGNGDPQVRIITDPLQQLTVVPNGVVQLRGVRSTAALRYQFREGHPRSEAEPSEVTVLDGSAGGFEEPKRSMAAEGSALDQTASTNAARQA